MSFSILGTGSALPERTVSNQELSGLLDTSDEWIVSRTGIHQRPILTEGTLAQLAAQAARNALEESGTAPEELDLILCTTVSGDHISPALACSIQGLLGASCPAYDLSAACAAFIFALDCAAGYFARGRVKRVLVSDMTTALYPEKPLVPFLKVTQDRVVLEIMRGCIRGCRFCQAGMIYRPTRERSVEQLKKYAYSMLKSTGHEEISLSSLSSSDYSQLKELVEFLIEEFQGKGINISLPSLRIDAFSLDVMEKVQDIRKSSLTFAPEAGSQRMRNVINKGLTEEMILEGAGEAFEGGWNKVKLYFMLGLPSETEEDMKAIPELADKIARRYYEIPKDQRNGKCQITTSTSFFIPKPFTPFQWAKMYTNEEYIAKAAVVKHAFQEQLNRKSLKYHWHDAEVTVLEGVLARGDRRVGRVIREAYRLGCLYDSWGDLFDNDKWMQAFEDTGVDIGFYNLRERSLDETFPWDFIDIGVTKQFLKKEWERAVNAQVTPNCRMQCSGCGVAKWKGGVCIEGKN